MTETNLEVTVERVTPAMAKEWLKNNPDNRNLRPTVVERYARDMRSGNWKVGGSAIVFNCDGSLIDGQHRLSALIEAGRTIEMVVHRGVDRDVKEAIDTGLRRNFADVLAWKGETQVAALAAAVRMGWRWQNGFIFGANYGTYTHAEGLDWYQHNPSVRRHLTRAKRLYMSLAIPQPAGAAFMHRIYLIDESDADSFMGQVLLGEGLRKGMPSYALRSWAQSQAARPASHRPRGDTYLAMLIKAWNGYAKGEDIQILAFKRGGMLKETLPELFDLDGGIVSMKNERLDAVPLPVRDHIDD